MFEARLPVTPERTRLIADETKDFIRRCFSVDGKEFQIQDLREWLKDNDMPDDAALDMIWKEYGNLWLKREYWVK